MWEMLIGVHNYSFLDSRWSAVHFSSGLLTGLAIYYYYQYRKRELPSQRYAKLGFVLLLTWEYFELILRYLDRYLPRIADVLKTILPSDFFTTESSVNIVSDLMLGSLGLYLVYQYIRRPKNTGARPE